MSTINTAQFADGFGPVSLARFAAAPGSSHVFRVQHALLARTMDAIVFESHSYAGGTHEEMAERALEVANSMTTLRSMIETHQVLESSLMHKVLAADPRQRLAAEQFEREAASAITEFEKLLISYGAPSQILAQMTDFSSKAGAVFARIKERFKAEERDLFPVFDRLTAGEDAAVVLATMSEHEQSSVSLDAPMAADKAYEALVQTSEDPSEAVAVATVTPISSLPDGPDHDAVKGAPDALLAGTAEPTSFEFTLDALPAHPESPLDANPTMGPVDAQADGKEHDAGAPAVELRLVSSDS